MSLGKKVFLIMTIFIMIFFFLRKNVVPLCTRRMMTMTMKRMVLEPLSRDHYLTTFSITHLMRSKWSYMEALNWLFWHTCNSWKLNIRKKEEEEHLIGKENLFRKISCWEAIWNNNFWIKNFSKLIYCSPRA